MNHLTKGLATALASLSLLGAALLVVPTMGAAQTSTSSTSTASPIQFGMDAGAVNMQKTAGVAPDYGTFWIGPWTLSSGWSGPDAQLAAMKAAGVTPAIHFYYWGDDITPTCVENGCWSSLHNAQKTRAGWNTLATQMGSHLNAKMGGEPVVIFLESEFNKGGISTYEPFDGYMADMAAKIHADYPNAIVVLGFGNWDSANWDNFDRVAAKSDMVGIQGMRGSTKQTKAEMMTLYDGLLSGVKTLETTFPGKPIMLTDIAVSSYPEPDYLQVQADVLAEVFDNLAVLKNHGVEAMIYRSWKDSPNMDLANYYGQAERHWGLVKASDGTQKAAAKVWIDGVQAERAGTTPAPAPAPSPAPAATVVGDGVTTQVETFATKQAGGKQADSAAQGGSTWNLWSNGAVAQAYDFTGDHDLTVRARGSSANGVTAHMVVSVGGVTVLSADPASTYADYRVAITGTGVHAVRIAFTNDAKTSTEDRNLLLDAVTLAPAPPPAPANSPPTATFQVTADGLTANMDGRASSDPDGDALSHAWDFGDGATATGPTASHAYAAGGTYTVVLTVSDGELSGTASRAATVTQPNRAPTASFAATASSLTVAVDGSASSDPDGQALTYAWTFGDGSAATTKTASHAYASAGTYTVTLKVSDGSLSSTATKSVTVAKPPAYSATFTTNAASNEWWVQEKVVSTPAPAKVDVRVNGGSWIAMKKESYGDWTLSKYIAKGSQVVFRATASDGQMAYSPAQSWLGAASTSTTTTTTTTAFKATFTPKAVGNNWWVETAVSANAPIVKVEAKVGGGSYTVLAKQDWGNYAKSIYAPNGSKVTFRATSSSGATATSSAVTWY